MIKDPEYFTIFLTQSQNSSAKIAIILQDQAMHYLEINAKNFSTWLRLSDNFRTSTSGFGFYGGNFFFPIVDKTVQQLTDTGIVNNLVKTVLMTKIKMEKVKNAKVLLVNDLSFGFVIWLMSCGISVVIFACEMIKTIRVSQLRMQTYENKEIVRNRYTKIEFAKVHPINVTRY